jgi:hypothetical protein
MLEKKKKKISEIFFLGKDTKENLMGYLGIYISFGEMEIFNLI